ncbi:MAG: T9SS type A sorting domain-containing protein, partial [Ignavibacteriaceae bacterium]
CYVAAVMNDSSRVNSYLSYIQTLLNDGQNPTNWYIMEAAFTLRAAKEFRILMGKKQSVPTIQKLSTVPAKFDLSNNYPNPFNPSTNIKVSLNQSGIMSLRVYNMLGELIKIVDQGYKTAGEYKYNVNMDNFASGIYLYNLQQGNNFITKKMILLK